MPQPKPWSVISSREAVSTRIFNLRLDRAVNPRNGHESDFTVLESPDWVNVIALTRDRRMVLIRQYRFGTAEVTLEIPGGLIDPGDSPEEAALRELKEETGFRPSGQSAVRLLGKVAPNPAFMDNQLFIYLVQDVVPGPAELEASEDISVELVPLKDIPTLVRSGEIDHALVLNAFFWLIWENGGADLLANPL